METKILIFIHLMAAAVGVGSLVFCLLLALPGQDKMEASEGSIHYQLLSLLAPTVFVSVLILVLTGVIFLFDTYTRQVDFTSGYYNIFGIKMIFVAGVFFLSAYQTFGLRGRITHLDLRPENKLLVPATLKKIRTVGKIILVLMSAAVFMGVWLARI